MAGKKLLKVRVSLKGRPINSFTFNKDVVLVGRNPEADIFLDNAGISREHLKLEMTTRGLYAVEDLGSANGTFLNDQPIKREYLMNNDVIRVGKFSMWVAYEEDRRGMGDARPDSSQTLVGTTVLSPDELEEMIHHAQEAEREAPAAPPSRPVPSPAARERAFPSRGFLGAMVVLAFLFGTLVASSMPWIAP
jgi:predicted component of type VI protein secretion system